MYKSINSLNQKIINCSECERLVYFRKKIAKEKRKQFINDIYWGKPINGYGDIFAQLLIIGLAPAAHGGNRTGRVFTGDKSSDFLYKCLYKSRISNQSTSASINDGLKLNDAYITAALKCVPPEDKPLKVELDNCSKFFNKELNFLVNLKVVVALGKIAFDACKYFYQKKNEIKNSIKFGHGNIYHLKNGIYLVGCYHPSPRNVNTGRISENKMTSLLKKVLKLVN